MTAFRDPSPRDRPSASRTAVAGVVSAVAVLGFAAKFYRGPAESWVADSLGGLLYVVFWCLVVLWIRPSASPARTAAGVFIVTCLLEFSQLSDAALLQSIRRSFLGRTLIGTTFVPSDFLYYALGGAAGWILLDRLRRRGSLVRTA